MRKKTWVVFLMLVGLHILMPTGAFSYDNDGWFLPYKMLYKFGQSDAQGIALGDFNDDDRTDVAVITDFYFDDDHDYRLYVFHQKTDFRPFKIAHPKQQLLFIF